MWTGGKPPPAPPSATPPSTTPNRYRTERQTELDQLRQRGLAKLLNKHFTSVTQSLAEERAAADAALRDLEARKAAGLKDWGDGGEQLSVWDQMYMELQQKKAECKRKERETLLLYQRYVDRFGNTGAVAVPRSPALVADASSATMRKGGELYSTPTKVPLLAGQIESNLARGVERQPSIKSLRMDVTHQRAFAGMNQQERMACLRALEGKGVDPLSTPSPQLHPTTNKDGIPECPSLTLVDTPKSFLTSTTTSSDAKLDPPGADVYHELDEDIRSIVSELTSAELSDAERVLVEFLKTETEAIRKLLDNEEASVMSRRSSYSNEVHSMSAKAADDAEGLVMQMEQILLDFKSEAKLAEDATASHQPRPLETSNPNEEWMVYWDDNAQREYYFEVHSNRAQWSQPSSAKKSSDAASQDDDSVCVVDYTRSVSDRSVPISYDEVMPMDDVPKQSRRDQYRRMRRRRRNRRLLFLAFLTTTAVGGGLYANRFHHEEMKSMLAKALGSTELADTVIDTIEEYLPDEITGRSERNEKKTREARMAAERKAREEEKALREKLAKEEKERVAEREVEQAAKNNTKNPFVSWLSYNPHYFLANSKRGMY